VRSISEKSLFDGSSNLSPGQCPSRAAREIPCKTASLTEFEHRARAGACAAAERFSVEIPRTVENQIGRGIRPVATPELKKNFLHPLAILCGHQFESGAAATRVKAGPAPKRSSTVQVAGGVEYQARVRITSTAEIKIM